MPKGIPAYSIISQNYSNVNNLANFCSFDLKPADIFGDFYNMPFLPHFH